MHRYEPVGSFPSPSLDQYPSFRISTIQHHLYTSKLGVLQGYCDGPGSSPRTLFTPALVSDLTLSPSDQQMNYHSLEVILNSSLIK